MSLVTLLHANDGKEWCNYLLGILRKSQNLKVDHINVDELEYKNPPEISQAARDSCVLVMLTSDDFQIYLSSNGANMQEALTTVRENCHVVLLELFVDVVKLNEMLTATFKTSESWKRFEISSDHKKTTEVCGEIVNLVEMSENALKPGDGDNDGAYVYLTTSVTGDDSTQCPRVRPSKKTRPGNRPEHVVEIVPKKLYRGQELVVILLKRPAKGSISYGFEGEDAKTETKRKSDTIFQFIAPDKRPGLYKLCIYEDDRLLNKRSLTYVAPNMAVFQQTPETLMAHLNLETVEELDSHLASLFESSFPEDDASQHLKALIDGSATGVRKAESQWPTLLHWAGAWGLSELVAILLEGPCACQAYNTENCHGRDPADLAEGHGHHELADYIRNFMSTKMVVDVYNEFYERMDSLQSRMSGSQDAREEEEEEEDTYSITTDFLAPPVIQPRKTPPISRRHTLPDRSPDRRPPVPRPPRRESSPPPLPPHPSKPQPDPSRGHPRKNRSESDLPSHPPERPPMPPSVASRSRSSSAVAAAAPSTPLVDTPSTPLVDSPSIPLVDAPSIPLVSTPSFTIQHPASFMGMRRSNPLPKEAQGSCGQYELLSLINSVKEGEFSQGEAQCLFKAWQQRYGFGKSRSFKEKQTQLDDMRRNYESMFVIVESAASKMGEEKQKKSKWAKIFKTKKQRKDNVHVMQISSPLPRPSERRGKSSRRESDLEERDSGRFSTASSSSCSSRDSTGPINDDSDPACHSGEDEEEQVFVMRRKSTSREANAQHRLSRKEDLLLRVYEERTATPPPRPPRSRDSQGRRSFKPIPAPR